MRAFVEAMLGPSAGVKSHTCWVLFATDERRLRELRTVV